MSKLHEDVETAPAQSCPICGVPLRYVTAHGQIGPNGRPTVLLAYECPRDGPYFFRDEPLTVCQNCRASVIRRLESPSDPELPLNCPACGLLLQYIVTLQHKAAVSRGRAVVEWEDAHIYRCLRHGRFWMSPSEELKPKAM